MFFSIIVPVYCVASYLHQCVGSILSQTDPDFELILVDDGSTDSSPAICDLYAAQDRRVRVLHQDHNGLSAARNAGIAATNGMFLLLVDADDFLPDREMLASLRTLLLEEQADVGLFRIRAWKPSDGTYRVKSAPYRFDILDKYDHDKTLHYLLSGSQFPAGVYSLCVKRSLLQDKHIAFVPGLKSEDYDWLLTVMRDSSRICATDQIFYTYRVGRDNSITQTMDLKHLRDLMWTSSKWTKAPGFTSPTLIKDIQNFAAYIFSTAMVSIKKLPPSERLTAYEIIRQHSYVLNTAVKPVYALIRLSLSTFGPGFTSFILQKLYALRIRITFRK